MASRSKFFYENSESSSDEQSLPEEKQLKSTTFRARKVFEDDDDDTELKRLVRTEKDKRFGELKSIIRNVANAKKINDFGRLFDAFETLCKAFTKSKKVVENEGIPKFYISTISNLQDFAEECWERDEGTWKKSLDKGMAKHLAILRQRIRKYNRDFEEQIKTYKENSAGFETSDSDDEHPNELRQSVVPTKVADFLKDTKTVTFALPSDADDESDDDSKSDWSDKSSDDDSSTSSLDLGTMDSKDAYKYFLKAEFTDVKDAGKDKQSARALKKLKRRGPEGKDERLFDEEGWEEVKEGVAQAIEKPKMFNKDEEVNHEAVLKKADEILQSRGKRGFDSKERCDLLIELRHIANSRDLGLGLDVFLLFEMIGLSLDRNRRSSSGELECDWTTALMFTEQAIDILLKHPEIKVDPNISDDEADIKVGPAFIIKGCILTVITILNSELTRILQNTDAHESEYVERLVEEIRLCSIIEKIQGYLESREDVDVQDICRIYYLNLEHKYFRVHTDTEILKKALADIDQLAQFVYVNSQDHRLRLSSILLQAYNLSIHDYWFRAKDLILMPFVNENIWHADIIIQIQYNRAQVQLGLCAFRRGLIREAHSALADIHSNNKARELLAQGIIQNRNMDRNPEQEKIDRQRLLPYHLHINLEVLECVYLMSAMLTDLSNMATPDFDARKRTVSKQFYHQLRQTEKQPCYGPPDNMREHIFAAVRSMKFGEWDEACKMLINPKMHNKVWRFIKDYEKVQEFVIIKAKEECLRIYMFTFLAGYDNIKLQTLSEMFELPDTQVKSIVSRMIYKREIMASLDQPTRCLVMHRTHPSKIQLQNLLLSEKVTHLVDSNDKMSSFASVSRLIGDMSGSNRKMQVR